MAPIFAEIAMMPGGVIAWILVGLISGWLAGQFMKGSGYGIMGDLVIGLIGSMVGGFLVSFFANGVAGFWGSIVVAFLGACVTIGISRAIGGRRVA